MMDSVLSERFTHAHVLTQLRILWNENWPTNHCCFDGILTDEHLDDLIHYRTGDDDRRRFKAEIKTKEWAKKIGRIVDAEHLQHGTSTIPFALSDYPCDFLEKPGMYWKRAALLVYYDPVPTHFEIWKGPHDFTLDHSILLVPNRAVLMEIRPDLYYAFHPIDPDHKYRVFWDEFYSTETPPYGVVKNEMTRVKREKCIKDHLARFPEAALASHP
jgi:hypothetical protein